MCIICIFICCNCCGISTTSTRATHDRTDRVRRACIGISVRQEDKDSFCRRALVQYIGTKSDGFFRVCKTTRVRCISKKLGHNHRTSQPSYFSSIVCKSNKTICSIHISDVIDSINNSFGKNDSILVVFATQGTIYIATIATICALTAPTNGTRLINGKTNFNRFSSIYT